MITLGKRGDLHARRQAAAFLQTPESVSRLFATVAPRYGERNGGYARIIRTGFRQGDGGEKAVLELLGAEQELNAKAEKRNEIRSKKREELQKQLAEQQGSGRSEEAAE